MNQIFYEYHPLSAAHRDWFTVQRSACPLCQMSMFMTIIFNCLGSPGKDWHGVPGKVKLKVVHFYYACIIYMPEIRLFGITQSLKSIMSLITLITSKANFSIGKENLFYEVNIFQKTKSIYLPYHSVEAIIVSRQS